MDKKVSVIIPCYNEVRHIDGLIQNLLEQNYPANCLEVLFAEGGSTDGTQDKLEAACATYPMMRIVENPGKFVPSGLNACIRKCSGDVIIRMDAHAHYPADYISVLTERLFALSADNVGGVLLTEPGDQTAEARAIAVVLSHPLGIGNAAFRTGSDKEKQTDTVPFGCFRRDLFDRIGLFDEELIRNQDDEFNGRIIRHGGTIWIIPSIRIRYFARPDRSKVSAMYYQYGLFKPLVNLKLGLPATLRQFAPPLLVLSGLMAFILPFFISSSIWLPVLWVCGYGTGILVLSIVLSARHGLKLLPHLLLTFPAVHFSYGIGYLTGLIKWGLRKQHAVTANDIKDTR
jgi:glycosyltransferase involved in cell wall biosynthesis